VTLSVARDEARDAEARDQAFALHAQWAVSAAKPILYKTSQRTASPQG
jgi:hypothetical protein